VLRALDEAGVEVESLSIHTPDLDDVFLALTGRPATSEPEPEPKPDPEEVSR
jgi:ABC-2 type transport system ATP-binding protein